MPTQEPVTPPAGVSPSSGPAAVTGPSPAVLAALRRRRRWRTWGVLIAISVGWKVVVLTLGAAVPRWLIDDGINELPAASQAYAAEAKVIATGLWSHPLERHGLVRRVRVLSVDSTGDAAPLARDVTRAAMMGGGPVAAAPPAGTARPAAADDAGGGTTPCSRYARVRAYTYFAIPYSEVRTSCGSGVVEYRVFRRRRPRG